MTCGRLPLKARQFLLDSTHSVDVISAADMFFQNAYSDVIAAVSTAESKNETNTAWNWLTCHLMQLSMGLGLSARQLSASESVVTSATIDIDLRLLQKSLEALKQVEPTGALINRFNLELTTNVAHSIHIPGHLPLPWLEYSFYFFAFFSCWFVDPPFIAYKLDS